MYSQNAEKRRTDCSVVVACTRSPSSSTPDGAGDGAHLQVAGRPQLGRRPRAGALQLHHGQAGVEIEADQPGRYRAAVAQPGLDAEGVEDDVADGDRVAARVEHDGAAEPAGAQPRRGRRGPPRPARGGRRWRAPRAARRWACAARSLGWGRVSRAVGRASARPAQSSSGPQDGGDPAALIGPPACAASSLPVLALVVRAELAGLQRPPPRRRASRYQRTVVSSAEANGWRGAQPSCRTLGGVERVATVVAGPVGHGLDQPLGLAESAAGSRG